MTTGERTHQIETSRASAHPQRRGVLPISGLMIIFGILLLGAALAIPATRAMQEAEMRDRIAAFNNGDGGDSSGESSDSAALPAYVEEEDQDVDESESETPEVSRNSDIASITEGLQGGSDPSEFTEPKPEAEPVAMPPPTHLRIPAIDIDTEVVEVTSNIVEIEGQRVREWEVASYAAGHHDTTANPGEGGNIVITGHNDWEGEVFRTLEFIEVGNEVFISTEEGEHAYVVEEIHMRREVGVSLEERLATGEFMSDMPEERVTLITCWPYGINDHRVIVVAKPVES